jgi:hemolysin III
MTLGGAMPQFDIREPFSTWSHASGMLLAIPITWILWNRCRHFTTSDARPAVDSSREQWLKSLAILVFGFNLTFCYGVSACFHAVPLGGAAMGVLHRLDHVGIYLLIAGSYTPVAVGLMRGPWRLGTLVTVWTVAIACAARVWCAGLLPSVVSTMVYLTMGWGSLFCYRQLARTYTHRTLMPLPMGGLFYSVGAIFNLAHWPVIYPGVFAAHELFHLFVIAGSAWHVYFMYAAVAPIEHPDLHAARTSPKLSAAHIPARGARHQPRPHLASGERQLPVFRGPK